MYCRKCGKQIEDDSQFCKYCGASSCDSGCNEKHSESRMSLYERFLSLSHGKQIALLVYCIWFLGWLGYLIIDFYENCFIEEVLFPFFLAVIVLPFVILACMHIYRIQKSRTDSAKESEKQDIKTFDVSSAQQQSAASNIVSNPSYEKDDRQVLETFTLKEFYILYGKMQVVSDKTTGIEDKYCIFTDDYGNVTKVSFSAGLMSLNAQDIVDRKNDLCIVEYKNKEFSLEVKH